MRKIVAGLALWSCALAADVGVDEDGLVRATACQHGRGELVAGGARDRALADIAAFLRGPRLAQELTDRSQLQAVDSDAFERAEILEQQRAFVLRGHSAQSLIFDASPAWLEGNDTCVQVTLLPVIPQRLPASDGEDSAFVVVMVVGQGFPLRGQTALERAERDALRRAVSQVVGVWLSEQRGESSALSMVIRNEDESTDMSDLMTHQLVSRSSGYVSEWKVLEQRALEEGGVELSVAATIDRRQVRESGQSLLAELGSPRVEVFAPPPLDQLLLDWLGQQNIAVSSFAPVRIVAHAEVRAYGNNRRLDLSVEVVDPFGNVYGRWRNDPSLVALPDRQDVYADLVRVHLATEQQRTALHESLGEAFLRMFQRGGLLREVTIPESLIRDQARLMTVVSTMGGISDVNQHTAGNSVHIQMRYPGPTDELATALRQVLVHADLVREPRVMIESDSLILIQ